MMPPVVDLKEIARMIIDGMGIFCKQAGIFRAIKKPAGAGLVLRVGLRQDVTQRCSDSVIRTLYRRLFDEQ